MSEDNTEHIGTDIPRSTCFIAGVVEGFYGKPWTKQQRKHLFCRLRELGLNTYFYAPKDDVKHRGQWRELYTQDETEVLSELILTANENDIDFVYALSPGIDIRYSDIKDVELIQDKLSQVRELGCKSFALLFDDIETEMQSADSEKFSSFAAAQVSVTNEVFEFLGCPKFFFCPTEYCETRAVPTLRESEYLSTLGNKLMSDIHVMWTGPQVISQFLTEEHVLTVADVLKRKPLIWDNLHANDYDPKRVFLGPFAGRPVQLKEHLSGLLLNPNCKFEANYIPLSTLADWYRANGDAHEVSDSNAILEAGGVSPVAIHAISSAKRSKLYHPLNSLRDALHSWITEFQRFYFPSIAELLNDARLADVEMASPKVLTEFVEAVVNEDDEETHEMNSLKPEFEEPMETASTSADVKEAERDLKEIRDELDHMDAEEKLGRQIDYDQLATFVDLFFLPFENGRRGEEILENFLWLYENSWLMSDRGLSKKEKEATQAEWVLRYSSIHEHVRNIKGVFNFLGECPNKQIVADLIPYIWESHGTVSIVLGVLCWLRLGYIKEQPDPQFRFWKNRGRDEPWVSSGGFINHIYRVLCGEGDLHDFCIAKSLLPLSIVDFSIRALDKDSLEKLSLLATAEDDRTDEQNKLNTLLFLDKYIHVFTEFDENFAFIAEDDSIPDRHNVISSVLAVRTAAPLVQNIPNYTKRLQDKYNQIEVEGVNICSIVEEIEGWFPRVQSFVVECFPSWLDVRFSATAYDAVPTKRMIHAVAVSLSLAGSSGMFVTIPISEENKIQFFKNIGFVEITRSEDLEHLILARSISRKVEDPTPIESTE